MWDRILELAIGDGLWALLFCVLLIYELKDSRARETKYQNTISSLAKDLEYVKDIDEEIKEIDEDIEQMSNAVKECMESIVKDGKSEKKKAVGKKAELTVETTPEAVKESA
ncbi:MAG: hypothetical protein K2I46_05900 [Clostridia bacterium]|nr:hypothetical protein [Clostridia bacterium]MDE6471569.1 hypothetical protein [Clostridia bacterium]